MGDLNISRKPFYLVNKVCIRRYVIKNRVIQFMITVLFKRLKNTLNRKVSNLLNIMKLLILIIEPAGPNKCYVRKRFMFLYFKNEYVKSFKIITIEKLHGQMLSTTKYYYREYTPTLKKRKDNIMFYYL